MYVYSKVIYADPECRTKTTQAKEATPSSHKVLASLSTCDRSSAKLAWESASCCSTCDAAGPDKTPLAGIKSTVESNEAAAETGALAQVESLINLSMLPYPCLDSASKGPLSNCPEVTEATG